MGAAQDDLLTRIDAATERPLGTARDFTDADVRQVSLLRAGPGRTCWLTLVGAPMPATGLLERRFVELELGEPMRSQRGDRLAWSR